MQHCRIALSTCKCMLYVPYLQLVHVLQCLYLCIYNISLTVSVMCCDASRGADKAAQDVLGQKPLDMLIKKGKVSDEELLMMLS